MTVPQTLDSPTVGCAFAYFATATNLDLTAQTGKPARCARRIVALAAGNWTLLKGSDGVDAAPGAVFQGFLHDAHTYVITSSTAIMVYW